LGGGRGLGVLLRQLARMHHHKAERFERYSSVAVFNLHLPAHALSMPAARRFILGPPGFLHHKGQRALLPPPGFERWAEGTGARDERDEGDLLLETDAQSTATIGLTIRDNATHPLQAQGQTFCNCHRSFHTIAAVTITHTQAQRDAAIPTHAQTEEH